MTRIDQVAGISHKDATKLRKAGVRTSTGLIEYASDRKGRADLADATGLDARDIQLWVNHSDLLRVRGVGAEYAELLTAAGVDTLRDLRRRNPTALLAKIIGLNGSSRVVRRLPTEAMVEVWIEGARDMDPSL
jgi:predicted RecB family nuclease